MSLNLFLATLVRSRYTLLAGSVLGALTLLGVQLIAPDRFEATTTLLISTPEVAEPLDGATYLQTRMPTYAELSTSEPVLEAASRALGISLPREELDRSVVAFVPESTSLITLTAEWSDPQGAADLADAVAQSFVDLAPGLDNPDRPVVQIAVLEPAESPDGPAGLSSPLAVAIGAVLGLTLALIIALVRAGLASVSQPAGSGGGRGARIRDEANRGADE